MPNASSESSGTTLPGRQIAIVAAGVGFLLTLAGDATAGLGVLLMWSGHGFGLSGGFIKRWAGGLIVAFIVGAFGMVIGGNRLAYPRPRSTTTPSARQSLATETPEPVTERAQLALIAATGYESESGGYHYVEGEVKNVSDGPLENVTAVADLAR